MHDIEPYYRWRDHYALEDDDRAPEFERDADTFNQVYNYILHPLWDYFGSDTLYIKILFADYDDENAVILECIGEWNDTIGNDVAILKRNVIEPLIDAGISKFVFIMDNVLNFHGSDEEYYAEWAEECQDAFNGGYIVFLETFDHVAEEMRETGIDNYVYFGSEFNGLNWRNQTPQYALRSVEILLNQSRRRLN
jgi:acetyltransferase-like isoleucine patch superfamily enzyme